MNSNLSKLIEKCSECYGKTPKPYFKDGYRLGVLQHMLHWAKYWYNTAFQKAPCMSPFEVLYEYPPPTIACYIQDISRSLLVNEYMCDGDATLYLLKTNLLRA